MTAAPRLLLLQARRSGDPMLSHEVAAFAGSLDVAAESLTPHDLTTGPPAVADAARFDVVLVGGSGEFSVAQGNLPRLEAFLELLRELVARRRPLFASCFGFHGLAAALGGEVLTDPERTEVGSYELTRSAAGADDELFGTLPERSWAQLGHQDRVTRLPAGWPNLAGSERSPFQALRVPGAPIWSTQFHAELTLGSALARYEYFLEHLASEGKTGEAAAFRERLHESPEASSLLRGFLALVQSWRR